MGAPFGAVESDVASVADSRFERPHWRRYSSA